MAPLADRRLSLRGSIIALIIAIGVVGPLAAGWVYHDQLVSRARRAAERTVTAINAEKAFQVAAWISGAISFLRIIQQNPEAHLLSILEGTDGRLDEVFILDGDTGEVVHSTDSAQLNKIRRDEDYFTVGRDGLYVSPPTYDLYRRHSVSVIAMPYRQGGRRLVLGAVLSPDGFAKILLTKSTTFQSEDSYLISSGNLLVSPPRFATDAESPLGSVHETFVNRCIAGGRAVEDGVDYRGVAVIVSYRWVEHPGACLVTQIDAAEFDESLVGLATSTMLIALPVVGGSLLAAFLVFAPLFRRISQTRQVFQSVGHGDITARLPTSVYREFQDVTEAFAKMVEERSRSEGELESARRDAEAANRTKSRFLAVVSHELRTPLTGMLGMLDLAQRRRSTAEIGRDIAKARTAGRHLLSLINQVLDFSKIDADRIVLDAKPFDVEALVRNAASLFEATARAKGVAVSVARAGDPPPALIGDPDRLAQVLFNLVGNAVKFTSQGRVTLRYGAEPTGERRHRLRVEVIDTGPGISPEGKASLFQEFAQIDRPETKDAAGTGLGLAISAGLITRMGGVIGVDSKGVGTGSVFHIELDLEEGDAVTAEQPKIASRPNRPLAILLADDVPLNCEVIAQYLIEEGHRVDVVGNGVECLQRLRSGVSYDVVLMDVNMPVLDGVEATRWIRAEAASWSSIPIIGLTADAFTEQRTIYGAAGMTDCLAKPIDWEGLLSALAAAASGQSDLGDVSGTAARAPEPVQPLAMYELFSVKQQGELYNRFGNTWVEDFTRDTLSAIGSQVEELANAMDDPERARSIGHAIRGLSANVGLARIAAGAGVIEAAARANRLEAPLIDALREAVAATIEGHAAFAGNTASSGRVPQAASPDRSQTGR